MRAIVFDQHGGVDVLRLDEVEIAKPATGQVRVAVAACSLNYHDIFTRRGMPGIRTPLPMVPGCDAAGWIDAVGAGVDGWKVGERVLVDPVLVDRNTGQFAMIGDTHWGACAEAVLVAAEQLIRLPDEVPFDVASCLPVAYGTAHRMLFTRGALDGHDTVLILGASGGVGTCCVQLAKMVGAHVTAAAGSREKCTALEALGADATIDYSVEDIVEWTRARTGSLLRGGGFDVVVNFTGGDTWARSIRCVRRGGRLLTCGATAGFDPPTDLRYIWTGELDIRGSNGWTRDDLHALLELVTSGSLNPVVHRRFALNEGIEAMRALEERRFFGKLVIEPTTQMPEYRQ